MKAQLRAGIIGCGRIAGSFDKDPKRKYIATHAGAYKKISKTKLVAVCDQDKKKLKEFSHDWKVKRLYTDYRAMLRKENLDVLSICTWPPSHFEIAKFAINAGIKTIFCEKPITKKLNEADKLIRLCEKNRVAFAVNHTRRWDAGHIKVKEFIKASKLGSLSHVICYYTAGISNTGTHLFDLLRFFLGDAKSVYASQNPVFGDQDPTLSGQILFKNGVLVTLIGLNVSDYLIFEFDFYGSKGRLRLTQSGFDHEFWKVGENQLFSGYKQLLPSKLNLNLKNKTMMINAVTDLIRSARNHRAPACGVEDGMKALELVCAFKESFKFDKQVNLPFKNRNAGV